MKYIIIEKWEKFQQYKDRRPTWIKLLIEIVDKYDATGEPKKFHPMPDSAKLTFILLACLRAKFLDKIPYESDKELKKLLGIRALNMQPLIDAGFISIISTPVQSCTDLYENAPPETERERERDRDRDSKLVFDVFRKLYPGKKTGLEPEWDNFTKKHKDWREILPLLKPALEAQIASRGSLLKAKEFVPAWKHLKTWINQSCWTEEPAQPTDKQKTTAELTADVEKFFQC